MKAIIAFDDSDAAKEALKFSMKFKGVIDEFIIVYVSPSLIGVTPTFDTYIPASVYQRQEDKQVADHRDRKCAVFTHP